jgi:mxaA protein
VKARALIGLFLLCLSVEVHTAIRDVEVEQPRTFGYVVGDVFKHQVQITLDDPWKLALDSMPKNGRIGIWLERHLSQFTEQRISGGTRYQFDFDYQIFNTAQQSVEVFTPQIELSMVNGDKQIPVFIHEWGFTVAPVTRDDAHQSMDYLELQPASKPVRRNTDGAYKLLIAGSAGLLFSLAVFGYIFGKLPGVKRTNGPFARTLSQLKVLQKKQPEPEIYQQALRQVHRAFNETAGQVVLSEDLDQFFIRQPGHTPLREPIEQLFGHSRNLFFESGDAADEGGINALLKLCQQCRDIERGLS